MLLGFTAILVGPARVGQERVLASLGACDMPPRSFEDVRRLLQLGRAPVGPLDGGAARPSTLDDVRTVLDQFVACSGAGEPLRVWSLYTDAYLARLLSRERGYDRQRYDFDAEPRPVAISGWPQVIALDGGVVKPSNRVVADVTIHYPNLDRTKQLRFWFVWTDGQLRIDEIDGEITFAVP